MNHTVTAHLLSTCAYRRTCIWQSVASGLLALLIAASLASLALPAAAQVPDDLWSGQFGGALGPYGTLARGLALDSLGNVYVAGTFTRAGKDAPVTVNGVAKWNSASWSPLGTGFPNSTVHAVAVDSYDTVYAGGTFSATGAGDTVNHIARWNGSAWVPLAYGLNNNVFALATDDAGNLYVAGSFTRICTTAACSSLSGQGAYVNHVAKWDGNAWFPMGFGLGTSQVNALAWDGGTQVYAGGAFTRICRSNTCGTPYTAANRIAVWDGAAWNPLGNGLGTASVNALAIDTRKIIYAAGSFSMAGGVPASNLAKWDGITWAPVGTGISSTVYSLVVDWADNLYAGGLFSMAGGVPASNLAKWDSTAWSAMGSGANSFVYALALPKQASATGAGAGAACSACAANTASQYLYAAGGFTEAGNKSSSYFAAWAGVPEPSTYVKMASFAAHWKDTGVQVTWQTALEVDNVGFHLYRADTPDGPWTRATAALIAAQGSGFTYHYMDATPGRYYKLEDIDTAGISRWHGPVAVQGMDAADTWPALYLPMLQVQ